MNPGDRGVHVTVSPGDPDGTWLVEIHAGDRPGLLARMAAVLTAARLDIMAAATTTAADGTVAGVFRCRSPRRPIPRALADAVEVSLHQSVARMPVTADRVLFDNTADRSWTICIVEADDRPGLLAAIAAAFTLAAVDIHRAEVVTCSGRATDRFEVTLRSGDRLDNAAMGRVRRALSGDLQRVRSLAVH